MIKEIKNKKNMGIKKVQNNKKKIFKTLNEKLRAKEIQYEELLERIENLKIKDGIMGRLMKVE